MNRTGSESGFHFLQSYGDCQQKFYYHTIERLEEKYMAPALVKGTCIHEALAYYYSNLTAAPWQIRMEGAVQVFKDSMAQMQGCYENDQWYAKDLYDGVTMLGDYVVRWWDKDNLAISEVLGVEEDLDYTFQKTGDVFTGRVDLRVTSGEGRHYIWDHKTTKWTVSALSRSLRNSDQATGYMFLWNQHHPDKPVDGLIYNILKQTPSGKCEFDRLLVVRTPADIERFAREAEDTLNEIAGKIGNPNAIWRRRTNNCFAWNRQCPYYDLCFSGDTPSIREVLFNKGVGSIMAKADE